MLGIGISFGYIGGLPESLHRVETLKNEFKEQPLVGPEQR